MIDIKTIAGEQLVSVPILQDAVIHEELMASDYIVLAWSSEDGRELPVGAYIEYEGERYSLYEPYTPTMVSEGEYRYSPQFHSREEAWNKQPACVYTYEEDGTTVKSREFDWTFVGSPADAMQIIKQAIKNEIGEDWSIVIADSLPATIEISSQTSSITSILSDIATQCETEYWVDKKENIIHLSKCEHGDAIALEVGNNVGVPSVMSKGSEYFTRYYALGSTRNITQTAGNISGAVNKRLTLDPNVFPMGYKDIRGHYENDVFVSDLENGEIFSKVVLFDDIYPSSDLEIISVRARMKYRLDGGKKVRVGGTDENPVYDQYAIWYFKIKDFTFSEDSLIEGLPLSVHFKSGRLAGQEFELIYHAKAKRENTDGDVLPFDIEAGDFEIKFKESSGAIIPDIAYIVPQNADKITLFNVEMPSEYTAAAQQRLLEALDKVIAREHEDSNTYEVESNPIAFYEANMVISLGQRVSFVNGDKSLETRVLMVERHLDSPSEQKIRVGNDLIQGSTKELRANVESLNHNVDVLSAFNDLSKNIQDSYGRTQALINEAVASVLGIWSLDENGNLVTEKQVIVKNNIIISGDTSTGGTGQDVPSGIDEAQLKEYLDTNKYITSDYAYSKEEVNRLIDEVNAGDIDLTNYYTKEETASEISKAIAGIDIPSLDGYAKLTDIPSLDGYAKLTDIPSLDGYATEQFVTDSITALNVGQYATKTALEALQGEVDNIEAVLGMDEEAEGIINTWNEVKAFLAEIEVGDDLASILEGINTRIGNNTTAIGLIDGRVTVNEAAIADNATNIRNAKGEIDGLKDTKADWGTTLAHYGITDAYTKTEVVNELAKYLLLESANQTIKGNITIEGNLVVTGDTASGARGTDSGTDGTLIGVIVNGTRYEDETNGMLDLSTLMNQYALATAIPTTLPASDVYAWAKKSSLALVDVPDLSSKYLPLTYAATSTSGHTITVSGSSDYIRLLRIFAPDLGTAKHTSFQVGVADSAYNNAQIAFYYAGKDSRNNFATFGMHTVDDQLTINGYGNVGIGLGTTAPSYKLHVNGTFNATTIYQNGSSLSSILNGYLPLSGGTISGSDRTVLKINSTHSTDIDFLLQRNGANVIRIGYYDTGKYSYLTNDKGKSELRIYDDQTLYFVPNFTGSAKYRILDENNYSSYALPKSGGTITGRLQVGADNNIAALEIATVRRGHFASFRNTVNEMVLTFGETAAEKILAMGDSGLRYSPDGTNYNSIIHSGNIGSYNAGSATKLQTARTIWGQSFDGTGNVKGGLTAVQNIDFESNNLHDVGSNSRQARYIYAGWLGSQTGKTLSFGANNGTHMLINSSGNVTIGASDLAGTTHKAYVNGLFRAGNTTINGVTIDLNRHANQGTILNTSCVGMEIEAYASYIGFKVYDTSGTLKGTPLALSNGGNVLIGTTTDNGAKLQVNGYGSMSFLYFPESDGTLTSYVGRGSSNSDIHLYAAGSSRFYTNGKYAMIINTAQNVLIGTTADNGTKLRVEGKVFINRYAGEGYTGGADVIINKAGTHYIGMGASIADNTKFAIGRLTSVTGAWASEDITIADNGAISMAGAVTMSSTLNVNGKTTISATSGDGDPMLKVSSQSSVFWNYGGMFLAPSLSAGQHFVLSVGKDFSSYNNGLIYFTYASSGSQSNRLSLGLHACDDVLNVVGTKRVGVNITNPQAELHVAGNAIISGDTSTGSDIRFKDKLSDHRIALSDIAEAPLFTFKWNDREDDSVHLGSSAQYWEKVTPWLVKGEDFKTLDYSTLGVAIGISLANKTLNLEDRVKTLEKENKALKEQIRRIQYGS